MKHDMRTFINSHVHALSHSLAQTHEEDTQAEAQDRPARSHATQRIVRIVAQRIFIFLVMAWIMSILIFLALRVLPGDVASIVTGTNSTVEAYARTRAQLGLDKPLYEQYMHWITGIFTGNLGVSTLTGQAMSARLASRSLVTFPLIILSMMIAVISGIALGVYSLTSRYRFIRNMIRALSILCGAIPAIWAGLLLVMFVGKGNGIFPLLPTQSFPVEPFGSWHDFITACASLIMPALCVGVITGAHFMRYVRSAIIDVEKSDYIAWSMASGMTYAHAVRTTGLRLAATHILSVAGMTFASMITGVLTVETLFNLPGLATMLITDISQRDLPAVQTQLFLLTVFFLSIGMILDVSERLLDPRMKQVKA